jgi:hypothetical protein
MGSGVTAGGEGDLVRPVWESGPWGEPPLDLHLQQVLLAKERELLELTGSGAIVRECVVYWYSI